MPLPPSLGKSFYQWARPKLRPLVEAHAADKKAGIKRYGSFNKLILQFSEEFEQQPFAQPDFEEYLDEDGEPTLSVIDIRDRAEQWLRNHARTSRSVQLSKFEAQGGVSERTSSRSKSAAELWAEDEKPRIRKATCEHLGIPVTTGNNALPPDFIGARKTVVKREFELLPQADQDDWIALAREEKERADRDQASVTSIQERQMSFAPWIDGMLSKKVKGGPLGDTFVMQFNGYFVRARDRQLERFRGQVDSGTSSSWFSTKAFKEVVSPAWTDFVHKDVEDKVAPPLAKFVVDATDDELEQARADLAAWLETMFRLACDFSSLDVKAFWKSVAEDPDKFVSPDRLPEDVEFGNPKKMSDDNFSALYKHIWRCQYKHNTVERDNLFIYEADAIREYVTLERVQHLKREQQRRKRKAAARASSGSTSATGDGAAPDTSLAVSAAPPATLADGDGEASVPRRAEEEAGAPATAAGSLAAATTTPAITAPATPAPTEAATPTITAAAMPAGANVSTAVSAEPMQVDAVDGSEDTRAMPSQSPEDRGSRVTASPSAREGRTKAAPASKPAGKPAAKPAGKPAAKPARKAAAKPSRAAGGKPSATSGGKKRRAADSDEDDEDRADDRTSKKLRVEPATKAPNPRYATRNAVATK